MLTVLVICSDNRADALGQTLSRKFSVYCRQFEEESWCCYRWEHGGWKVPKDKIPSSFDILFFHTGMGDPKGIPTGVDFTCEFAFSTPGLTHKGPASRSKAIPIQQVFSGKDDCPVKHKHLEQLDQFSKATRTEPPDFCFRKAGLEFLPALSILCQGYLAVHADPETKNPELDSSEDDETIVLVKKALNEDYMNWGSVDAEMLGEEMQNDAGRCKLRLDARRISWWNDVFAGETDVLGVVQKEWNPSDGDEDWSKVEALVRLFRLAEDDGPEKDVPPAIVAKAYCAIHARLARAE